MNLIRHITVSCPSRLHFGLFAVGQRASYQYGGIGLMIRAPRTEIAISKDEKLQIVGLDDETIRATVENWLIWQSGNLKNELGLEFRSIDELPVRLEVLSTPPRHQGFGTGTQIAFATALALNSGFRLPVLTAEEFAIALNRGKRSAIGSFGFFLGGILVDRGKARDELISPLDFRVDFPIEWPILMILDRAAYQVGLSGAKEFAAFDQLPDTSELERQAMVDLAQNEILSPLLQRDYPTFANGVYEFGRRSGLFFESVQGGAYHSPQVADLVEFVRASGVPAVGQSSWGLGVFAILPTIQRSHELINKIQKRFPDHYELITTVADNRGVVVAETDSQGA